MKIVSPTPPSFTIAQSATPVPLKDLISGLGIREEFVSFYGRNKAKISLDLLKNIHNPKGKYIVVAGMTPTPLGEGKSTSCIGISQALGAHLNKRVFTCIRQPSMGPTFGIKGGAAGGGYSQVIPMDEFNLHLTGDIHAVSVANNLLCAQIDTRIYHEKTCSTDLLFSKLFSKKPSETLLRRISKVGLNPLNIDSFTEEEKGRVVRLNIEPATIVPNRVVDVNDRMVRGITIGLGDAEGGKYVRNTKIDIAVSCEIMAVLALATGLANLHERLARMLVGYDFAGEPVTVDDLSLTGALTVLLKDALCPTLMQTLEGTPVFVHCGPFANIAHGNSSVIADEMALRLVGPEGFVLTECGFGSDMGLEKLVNIKCRQSGLRPDCVVLVATVRALKHHGNSDLAKGICNLEAHVSVGKKFNLPVVVCINQHFADTVSDLEFVRKAAISAGAAFCEIGNHFAQGGQGAVELANRIVQVTQSLTPPLPFTYATNDSLRVKVENVCKTIYGAAGIELSVEAENDLTQYEKLGFGHFSICMAKTQYSLSHDPLLLGRPTGFTVPISRCRASVGAGFIYLLIGPIMTMPGLPIRPAFYDIEIDLESGDVIGMF